jgi:hypothetical protein
MKPKNMHTEVVLHPRRRTGRIAEVKIFDSTYLPATPIPGGVIFCEVKWIPEVIKALRQALKMAKEEKMIEDYTYHPSTSGEEHNNE